MDNQQVKELFEIPFTTNRYLNKSGQIFRYNTKGELIDCTPKKPDTSGYLRVAMSVGGKTKHLLLHRVILCTYTVESLNSPLEVNHIDGNKLNNRLDNLEWVTRSENLKHAFRLGLNSSKGELNGKAVINESQVIEIYHLCASGMANTEIAKLYGVTKSAIGKIKSKSNWEYLLKDLPDIQMKPKAQRLPESIVHDICKDIAAGWKTDYLVRKYSEYGLKTHQVEDIRRGRCYSNISKLYKDSF